MSARTRWMVVGVTLVVVLGLVALYSFNTDLSVGTNLQHDEVHPSQAPRPGLGSCNRVKR